MLKSLYFLVILITISNCQQNAGIKVTLLPRQVNNIKDSLFNYFYGLVVNSPLPTSFKGDYNISNARIQNFNLVNSDVIISQGNESIFVQAKIANLDMFADVTRNQDFFSNVSFTTSNDMLYLDVKPFLDINKQFLYFYISNITLTLNNIRIRSQDFKLRGLSDRPLFVALESLFLRHLQAQVNLGLKNIASMSQNSASFPGTPVSMRLENTQLPFIDLSRITYFIDGSFFVTDNNSISLPISNNVFPDWDVNATQGAQMLISDDVINSALFAYWSSQELSINIGSFGQPNNLPNSNSESGQTESGGAQGAQPAATEAQNNGGTQGAQGGQPGATEAQNGGNGGNVVGSPPPAGGATEAGGAQKGGAGAQGAGNTEAGNNNNNKDNNNNGNNNNGQQNSEAGNQGAGNQGAGNTEAGALKNQKNAPKNNKNQGGRVVGTVKLTTTQQIQKLKFWLQNGRIIRNVKTSTKITHKNANLIAPAPNQNPAGGNQGQGNSEAPQSNNNNNLEAGNNNQGGKGQNTEAANNNNQGGQGQAAVGNNNNNIGGKGQNTEAGNAQKQQKGNQNQESPANPQGKPNTEAGNVGSAQGQAQGQGQGGNNVESMTESQNQGPPVQSPPPGPSIPNAGYVFETPIQVTTELFDFIIPGLKATYGVGGNVALHCFYNSTNAPSIASQDGSSTGIWNGTCQVWVNNGTWYQAVVLYGSATLNVTIQVDSSNMISYNFNFVKIDNLSHDQSMIGNVDDQQVQNNLNMLLLWPTNVKNSIEIPIGQNAFGNNAIALFRNGFVEILGDLNFNPVTP